MSNKRPPTMREIKAKKDGVKSGTLLIQNVSRQVVHVSLKAPIVNGKRVDFFRGSQDVMLQPNKMFEFKKDRLWMNQVERLCKQKILSVISDSDHIDALREEQAAKV